MFCGMGPFPIVIAHNKPCEITSVRYKRICNKIPKENIELNKLKGTIHPICGDINQVAKNNY